MNKDWMVVNENGVFNIFLSEDEVNGEIIEYFDEYLDAEIYLNQLKDGEI